MLNSVGFIRIMVAVGCLSVVLVFFVQSHFLSYIFLVWVNILSRFRRSVSMTSKKSRSWLNLLKGSKNNKCLLTLKAARLGVFRQFFGLSFKIQKTILCIFGSRVLQRGLYTGFKLTEVSSEMYWGGSERGRILGNWINSSKLSQLDRQRFFVIIALMGYDH